MLRTKSESSARDNSPRRVVPLRPRESAPSGHVTRSTPLDEYAEMIHICNDRASTRDSIKKLVLKSLRPWTNIRRR